MKIISKSIFLFKEIKEIRIQISIKNIFKYNNKILFKLYRKSFYYLIKLIRLYRILYLKQYKLYLRIFNLYLIQQIQSNRRDYRTR